MSFLIISVILINTVLQVEDSLNPSAPTSSAADLANSSTPGAVPLIQGEIFLYIIYTVKSILGLLKGP